MRDMRSKLACMRSTSRTNAGSLAPPTQESEPQFDRSQGVTQVVAKNRQEALLKLLDSALLGTGRALCGHKGAQVLFSPSALGEIAGDLRESDQRALGVAERA